MELLATTLVAPVLLFTAALIIPALLFATTALVNNPRLYYFTFPVHLNLYQVVTVRVNHHTMLYTLTINIANYQYIFFRMSDSVTASQQRKLSIVHTINTKALIECPISQSCLLIVRPTFSFSKSVQYISSSLVVFFQMIGKVINITIVAILFQYILWQERRRHTG